jgi:NhaA family Na+:H+ antiporter
MKRYLPFIIVILVALLALVGGIVLYRAERPAVLSISKEQMAAATNSAESIHVRGNPNAPVTIEEFGDFQCPPCGRLAGAIVQLEHDYDPRLRVIFRNFPLAVHAHAREAALAAEAAGLQGRFWEMHDLLYREQSVWSKAGDARALFNAYAGILGLSVERFEKDMAGDKAEARVKSDQQRGATLGVQNTPTIFLNDRAIPPSAANPDGLREAIDAATKNVKSS